MFGNPKWFSDYMRVKIGHFQPNYGDMQFRRSDGGNTMYNPFCENLILDAFTTEIGGEVYVFPADGFMGMVGMSSGFINGNIEKYPDAVNTSGVVATKKTPSLPFVSVFIHQSEHTTQYAVCRRPHRISLLPDDGTSSSVNGCCFYGYRPVYFRSFQPECTQQADSLHD
jgi:hypothetical protein